MGARAETPQRTIHYGACAVVASSPPVVSLAKVFVAFARDAFRATTVVDTVEEAEHWLRQA